VRKRDLMRVRRKTEAIYLRAFAEMDVACRKARNELQQLIDDVTSAAIKAQTAERIAKIKPPVAALGQQEGKNE
jgi:adenylosuccinate lyase